MKLEQKQQIKDKLNEYVLRFASQNKAANSLNGVSAATISQILNDNWDLIKDEMWRNIASQIGWSSDEWNGVNTRDFQVLTALMKDAQLYSNVFAVTGEAGTGKSYCMRQFSENHERAYWLSCSEFMNKKHFLGELMKSMGRDSSGLTVSEMMGEAVKVLKSQESPLLILDEADKLTDQVLYFFITLYNHLEDRCGIILCATDHLSKRIQKGLKLNKKGYKEIYSRIGRKFIELPGLGSSDISIVCQANGIEDIRTISRITKQSEFDLRRVKRMIHAEKLKRLNEQSDKRKTATECEV